MKADLHDLERIAEDSGYMTQLSIGGSDLISLEPCDSNLFPLRYLLIDNEENIAKYHA